MVHQRWKFVSYLDQTICFLTSPTHLRTTLNWTRQQQHWRVIVVVSDWNRWYQQEGRNTNVGPNLPKTWFWNLKQLLGRGDSSCVLVVSCGAGRRAWLCSCCSRWSISSSRRRSGWHKHNNCHILPVAILPKIATFSNKTSSNSLSEQCIAIKGKTMRISIYLSSNWQTDRAEIHNNKCWLPVEMPFRNLWHKQVESSRIPVRGVCAGGRVAGCPDTDPGCACWPWAEFPPWAPVKGWAVEKRVGRETEALPLSCSFPGTAGRLQPPQTSPPRPRRDQHRGPSESHNQQDHQQNLTDKEKQLLEMWRSVKFAISRFKIVYLSWCEHDEISFRGSSRLKTLWINIWIFICLLWLATHGTNSFH